MRRGGKQAILCVVVIALSLVMAACSDNTPAPPVTERDLPKDRFLYLGNRDGWPDLYTLDQTGKTTRRLTESPEAEYGAVWSPDGKRVAFTVLNGDQATGDYQTERRVVVMDADGKNRTTVADNAFNPVWSPDSKTLLVIRTTVTTLPATSPSPTALASPTPSFGLTRPTPTLPTAPQKSKLGLYSVNADGSQAGTPKLLADDAVYGVWSPDGKRVAYVEGSNAIEKPRRLFIVGANGDNKQNLSERAKLTDQDILYVSWSPDGNNLAYTAVDTQNNKANLWRIGPDTSASRRLTEYQGSGKELTSLIWAYADYGNPAARMRFAPVWSPNSRLVAVTEGSARLTISEADTGNSKFFAVGSAALGQDKDSVLGLSWLPDNRRLIYDRASIGRNALLSSPDTYAFDWFNETLEILDTSTKNTKTLPDVEASYFLPTCCGGDYLSSGPEAAASPAPSPTALPPIANTKAEGRLIYTTGVGQQQLIVQDLAKGQRTVLNKDPARQIDFNLSPSNDQIAYLEVGDGYNSKLYVSSLDGTKRRLISQGSGQPDDLTTVVEWSPDGKQIAFQALASDPNLPKGFYTLTVESLENTSNKPRAIVNQDVFGFSWSPDGSRIAYRIDDDQFNLFVVASDGSTKNAKPVASLGYATRRNASLGRGIHWSPDGKTIAMAGSRYSVWLISPEGKVKELNSSIIGRLLGWSADSRYLVALSATATQNSEVQLFDTSQSDAISLGSGTGPVISNNSQYVAFFSRTANRNGVASNSAARMMIVPIGGGRTSTYNQRTELPINYVPYYSYRSRFFSWSPSGNILAYYENNTIWGVGPDGRSPQPLARGSNIERLAWAK